MSTRLFVMTAALGMGLISGCQAPGGSKEPGRGKAAGNSLYARLGGEKAIRAVVDDFVEHAAADPKVNFARKGTTREWDPTPENTAHVKEQLTVFLCEAAGGPQRYSGKDMKAAHKGMLIGNAEYTQAAHDLEESLDRLKVPETEKREVLALVESLRKEIVE